MEHQTPQKPSSAFLSFSVTYLLLISCAVSNQVPKLQEFCVKKKDRVEVICMIGVYGFLVSVVEMYPSAGCLY